jgi:glycine/D-amino acid oxidase-like deaminating enzyme
MTKTADVVVVGGGVNGCSIAYHLARRGTRKIVLVEKGHVASGPTGVSSGVVRQHYTHETLAAMARDSVRVFERFHDEIGGDAGFVQCGVVFLSGRESARELAAAVEMHRRIGIRESLLSAADLKAMDPAVFHEDVACGAYDPDGGYADPTLAANGFADAAKRLGVEILKRTTVTGLTMDGGKIAGVRTDKGDIGSGTVVNAAGPWGARVAAMAGIQIPITVTRHAVVVTERPASWRYPTPVWGDLVSGWYFKPDGQAGMMVGSVQDDHRAVDADDYVDVATHDEIVAASDALLRRFPIMEEGTARSGWAGLYDVTPDSQPVIDAVAEVPGLFCAVGFSGHGFKIAPAVGRIVSELVLDGRCDSYNISLFRHARFATGDLHPSAYAYGILG